MVSERDRAAWIHIFKLYKGFPHLWDKNNANFGNRSMMRDSYQIMTRIYRNELDKQANVNALRMKMKNLRTTYYRELRKMNSCKLKGVKYTPSLWYFEHLNFLRTPKPKNSATDVSDTEQTEEPDTMQEQETQESVEDLTQMDESATDELTFEIENSDSELNSVASTPIIKHTKKKINMHEERRVHLTPLSPKMSMRDDQWEVIGKSIGYQLQSLSNRQYTIVSKLISDAIYFGRLNRLTEGSHLQIGRPSSNADPQTLHYNAPSAYNNIGLHSVEVPTDRLQTARFKNEANGDDDDED